MVDFITKYGSSATRILLVRACLVCARPIRQGPLCRLCVPPEPIIMSLQHCLRCSNQIEITSIGQTCSVCIHMPSILTHQRYLWPYQGLIRDLIIAMKYSPSKKLAIWGAEQLLACIHAQFICVSPWDVIVPIPSSPKNYANRLFSPSRVMADYIGKKLKIPVASNILYHREVSKSQTTLSHAERYSNAQRSLGAYAKRLQSRRVLMIDDVVTTGATANSCARLLLKCGAQSVDLYSLARAPSWDRTRRLLYKR